ncbi:hypothetical protein WA026_010683 [Henosepilachna vigintioctopunctata]
MPAIYISKYNRFVDNIIGRINRILGKSYDPVRVKLQSSQSKKNKTKNTKSKNKKKSNRRKTANNLLSSRATTKIEEIPIARSDSGKEDETSFILISRNSDNSTLRNITVKTVKSKTRTSASNSTKNKNKNANKNKTKSDKKKNKTKSNTSAKARATLFGLSTIKRDGDVTVNMKSDHTTVKTNFMLGPLTLRVEREFGKGARRELKSATATTAEMYGRLNLRIIHGGAATLHSIRVLQPKQLRIDSAENHEKTKEFLWKRTSHIASVVSHKLASAARSMLKPPPKK